MLPMIIWGSQRVWTKGHPKRLGRTNTPISVDIEKPVAARGTAEELTNQLLTVMGAQLLKVQEAYPEHPAGAYWVPARLGGSAPTLDEAEALDREETKAKVAARREKVAELKRKGKL